MRLMLTPFYFTLSIVGTIALRFGKTTPTSVHGSTVSILQILKRERGFESEKRSNLKREIASTKDEDIWAYRRETLAVH
jgi:hypothetical protein